MMAPRLIRLERGVRHTRKNTATDISVRARQVHRAGVIARPREDGPLTIRRRAAFVPPARFFFPRFARARAQSFPLPPPCSRVLLFPRLFIDPKYHPGRMMVLASERVPAAAAAAVPFLRNGTRQP